MKKEVFRESKKYFLIVDIILYNLICLVGILVLCSKELDFINTLRYFYLIFFVIAFISVVAYFVNRRKDDYEFLFYALINVYVGAYSLIYVNYKETWFILGSSLLVYTIANILNKGMRINTLDRTNSVGVVSKLSILVVVTLLSVFTAINLYANNTIEYSLLGYYFLTFGLISLIEPYLYIILHNKKISNYLCEGEVSEKAPIKEPHKAVNVSKRTVKKPVKKETTKKKIVKK